MDPTALAFETLSNSEAVYRRPRGDPRRKRAFVFGPCVFPRVL